MKKRILILGNNEGLSGVKVDIANYKGFFKSGLGGAWYDEEISIKLNPSRYEVTTELTKLKRMALDYLIVVFSGHGGQKRETVLELNSIGEQISESELKYIAERQLNIFDCCRAYSSAVVEGKRFEALAKAYSYSELSTIRAKFDARIMRAISQQVSLYSCSIGEISNDTDEGGLYSKYLIRSAKSVNGDFKLVGTAHSEAYDMVMEENKKLPPNKQQHPDAILPKCLSEQQLILGIR